MSSDTNIVASTASSATPFDTKTDLQQPDLPAVNDEPQYEYTRDYRFWSIIFALCTMQVLCSLENTVVVTSLPTIVRQLGLGSSYIWVTNIFFLAT